MFKIITSSKTTVQKGGENESLQEVRLVITSEKTQNKQTKAIQAVGLSFHPRM